MMVVNATGSDAEGKEIGQADFPAKTYRYLGGDPLKVWARPEYVQKGTTAARRPGRPAAASARSRHMLARVVPAGTDISTGPAFRSGPVNVKTICMAGARRWGPHGGCATAGRHEVATPDKRWCRLKTLNFTAEERLR
jgi:hypothetical protein